MHACNMNVICVLIAVGIIINSVYAQNSSNFSKIERLVLDRCKKYSHEAAAYDNIKDRMESFADYLRLAFSHIPNEKHQFCDEDRPRLVELMRQLAKDLKQCVPKEEKYLPNFVYQSFAEFLHFLCDKGGKNIDNFFSTLGKDCLQKLKGEQAGQEVGHCFKKLIAPPLDGVLKKDDLCNDLTNGKKCFNTALTKHCSSFVAFESLNSQLFKAIRQPCNAATSVLGISGFLLMIVAFFTTKVIT